MFLTTMLFHYLENWKHGFLRKNCDHQKHCMSYFPLYAHLIVTLLFLFLFAPAARTFCILPTSIT